MKKTSRYSGAWLVFAGGALGTFFRYLVSHYFEGGTFPAGVFAVNILGAFLLAWAVGAITSSGALTPKKVRFRLFFGTGMMGGFTTYSTFALQTAGAVSDNNWALVASYGLGTVLLGAVASVLGLLLGRARAPRNVESGAQ